MVEPIKLMVRDLRTGETMPVTEADRRRAAIDIADRLESASYNGVSRTLRSNHCRAAANEIRRLRQENAELRQKLTVHINE